MPGSHGEDSQVGDSGGTNSGTANSEGANANEASFIRMDLEKALRGPEGKAAAEKLVARIDALAKEIEVCKHSGLSTDDYSRVETLNKALAVARGIVLGIQPISHTKDVYP